MATDGGSAFPALSGAPDEDGYNDTGMSLFVYHAAHAPAVPDWFECVLPNVPTIEPVPWSSDEHQFWKGYGDWLDDEQVSPALLEQFKAYKKRLGERDEKHRAAVLEARFQHLVAWRYAYAAAMLKGRPQ